MDGRPLREAFARAACERFHRLHSERKNVTRSVSTSSVRKKGISVAEIMEMKAVLERRGSAG